MHIFGISVVTILLLAFAYWLGSQNALNRVVAAVAPAA